MTPFPWRTAHAILLLRISFRLFAADLNVKCRPGSASQLDVARCYVGRGFTPMPPSIPLAAIGGHQWPFKTSDPRAEENSAICILRLAASNRPEVRKFSRYTTRRFFCSGSKSYCDCLRSKSAVRTVSTGERFCLSFL